jgi:hypothetical protein
MTSSLRSAVSFSILCFAPLLLVGCSDRPPALPPSVTPPPAPGEQTTGEHHHPDHGKRGGHMMDLSDGSRVEVMFADDLDLFTVWAEDPDKVSKVEMITTVDGKETTHPFEKTKTFVSWIFARTDPQLATAAKMGDSVDIKLVIAYEDRELTGKFEHHEH